MSNRIGDAIVILAIIVCFPFQSYSVFTPSLGIPIALALALSMASFTKRAQLPLSAWLPAAIAAPTPVSALVHSSTLVTAGVFLIFRFYPSLHSYYFFFPLLFYSGVATSMIAGTAALFENDLKKIIALSTLSQLGVIIISIGLAQPFLSLFHLLTHAIFKALLFICAGNIIHRAGGSQDIRHIGIIWKKIPLTSTSLNLATLSLCGFPFIAGFYSKDFILETFIIRSSPISTAILCFATIVTTAAYSTRIAFRVIWSPTKNISPSVVNDESITSYLRYLILAFGAIFSGNFFLNSLRFSADITYIPFALKISALVVLTILAACSFKIIIATHKRK